MEEETRVYVSKRLLNELKEKFAETEGMTFTGVVDWALRYLLKLKQLKYLEA